MERVIFFIDGFNLYHSIADDKYPHLNKYKWLNLNSFANHCININEKLEDIYFFTAFAVWDQKKIARHKKYLKALESVGVKNIKGKFKKKTKTCRRCHRKYETYEEKETDVNIAIYMFKLAFENKYDKAYIVSCDSDLVPAITMIKKSFPTKGIGVVIPINQKAYHIKNVCDSHFQIKEHHLKANMFPDRINLPSGIVLTRPLEWI